MDGFEPRKTPNAVHASAVFAMATDSPFLQWRVMRGAFMRDPEDEIFAPKPGYSILQLERSGKTVIFRAAHPGEPLQVNWLSGNERTSGRSIGPDCLYARTIRM